MPELSVILQIRFHSICQPQCLTSMCLYKQNQAQHSAYSSNPLRPDANVGTTGTMHHSQMVNNDMGAGGVQLPMSGVVPLAEPPPKRQKTVNLQVYTWRSNTLVGRCSLPLLGRLTTCQQTTFGCCSVTDAFA